MLRDHATAIDRIEADESIRLINALIAAGGRAMRDGDQRSWMNSLERLAAGGHSRQRRAPKITPEFAKLLGANLASGTGASTNTTG